MVDTDITVVVPVFNEVENVAELYERIARALDDMGPGSEMIFVDDGSSDGSLEHLLKAAHGDDRVSVIEFIHNFGQTQAMRAGFSHASRPIVVSLDADLQNSPGDIPRVVRALVDGGWDIVSGWRRDRKDPGFTKKLPSRISNGLARQITGTPVHDQGCTLKAYRREVVRDLGMYGQLHRYFLILAGSRGARIGEVVVSHHPRTAGTTKYGFTRLFRGSRDLIGVAFHCYREKIPIPTYIVSGGLGALLLGATCAAAAGAVLLDGILVRIPLALLATGLLAATLFLINGLAEGIRIGRHLNGDFRTYRIRKIHHP